MSTNRRTRVQGIPGSACEKVGNASYPYHVTNVKEDGTIPQFEKPHWQNLNTFRTNAQIENGGVCKPKPQG